MSARLPSRWLFAAALLAAEGLTSAAVAQAPALPAVPPVRRAPQTAPATQGGPFRASTVPLLLEEEQTSEHADLPRAVAPPAPAMPPRVLRACGLPEYDRDDDERMSPDEVTLRCLLFTVNPLAAFLPLQTEVPAQELPPAGYLQHAPQYCPPSPSYPLTTIVELVGMPDEVERIEVMPKEVEELDVRPVEEESEPHYELLGPWIDSAGLFHLRAWPLAEFRVSVQDERTGSLRFGVGIELSRTGTVLVSAEPPSAPKPEPIAMMPAEKKATDVRFSANSQVQLELLVAEVTGAAARKLNLDHSADGKPARWVIEVADEDRYKALQAGLVGLREKGRAKVVAEPRLVTLSGQPASFLSGGEQAVPVLGRDGQVGVQFEEFGTRINCLPVVLEDGTVRLEVEPEISELCDTASVTAQGTVAAGRSAQRVHTTADVAPGHTLVISGPKAGGNRCLLVLVTPTVVTPPTGADASDPQRRTMVLMNQSENLRQIEYEMERFWMADQPSRLTQERVRGGTDDAQRIVHELLLKCQRELSRGHYAGAQDLAQEAIERDGKQVAADPLVTESHLLQRVKEIASLPLGTVDPCAAKAGSSKSVPAAEAKAIGSPERMVEALMREYNVAFQEARYGDAADLAERALQLDPHDAAAAAALQVATNQRALRLAVSVSEEMRARCCDHLRQGRYEEARNAALQALSAAPGDPVATAVLQQACEALSRLPRPEPAPQCTYVGTHLRPMLPPIDPAVVSALQKLLLEGEQTGPVGGSEESEPKAEHDNTKPPR